MEENVRLWLLLELLKKDGSINYYYVLDKLKLKYVHNEYFIN